MGERPNGYRGSHRPEPGCGSTVIRWAGFLGLEVLGGVMWWTGAPFWVGAIPALLGLIVVVFGPRTRRPS